MPKNSWIVAAGLWVGACCSGLSGASPRFMVDRFDPEKGLPQSCVVTMTQTRDGYLWVGTLGGLARFDGVGFTVYNPDNTPGLKSWHVVKLFEDGQTNLWVGTENAGIVLVTQKGKVIDLPVPPGSAPGRLLAACEDASGAVWLRTADTGTDQPTGRLVRFHHGGLVSWPLGPSHCRELILEHSGDLWVGTDGSQIALRPDAGGAAGGFLPVAEELPVARLDFLLASKLGGYWRLAGLRIQKCRTNRVERDLGPYPWDQLNSPVTTVCEDQEGNLLAGTSGGEVYWFDAAGRFTRIGSEAGLPRSPVLSLYVDREGCLWVGTSTYGLLRVKRQVFEVWPASAGSVVQSVCADGQAGFWVGYHDGRLHHWTGELVETFTNIYVYQQSANTNEPAFLLKESVYLRTVFVDRDRRVWAGSEKYGLFQFQDGGFKPAPGADLLNPHISAIHQDRQGVLWVGTAGGLGRWDGQNWRTYATLNGLSANAVQAIADDQEGNLWVGTAGGGLNRLRDGQFTWFTRTNGLPSDNVASLLVDKEGVLWAGTSGGLARCRHGQWTCYTRKQGLQLSNIGYLLEDEQGYLWLGSNAGLIRVAKQALNALAEGLTNSAIPLRTYGELDGLPTSECTFISQPAACRTQDGRLWFPTIHGLVSVDPAQLHPNTNQLPVVIESVFIGGQPQNTNNFRLAPPQAASIPAGKEGLAIHFTSLNLAAAERARFRYRLEGYERAWTPPSDKREAYYGKLPPGRYTFHVTACNEDGLWSREGSTLAVTVWPPFWQTWWFLSAAALGLLGLLVGSVHYISTQKLQRQLAVLRQHEALEAERARIARDLHDQLGANLTQVALLGDLAESDKGLPEEVSAHARQISQTARDTTRALEEIVWTVNPANDTLDGLLNYICKCAQEYLAMAGLRYRLEVPAQLPAIPISPELRHNVFLAAKEALNNVVKHARASAAWLRLRLEPGRFVLEIEDDGRGLSPADEHKGRNGLRNMRRRMEDLGGSFAIGPGPMQGTVVRLSAPLSHATR